MNSKLSGKVAVVTGASKGIGAEIARQPPNSSIYSGTKGAVDTITRVLANELGPRKIRVNAINPGLVETEGTATAGITADGSDFVKHTVAATPLGRAYQNANLRKAPTRTSCA